MQILTPDLQNEQLRATQRYYRHVELLKRYWDAGTSTYKWDTAVNIDAYVSKVSTAKWKLDIGALNEFKSPNFQVEVDNRRNIWAEYEVAGIWQTGDHAPYVPELSRVRVRTGHVLPDGTEEDVYVFGGVIGKPLAFNDEKQTASMSVVGMDELLRRTSAEDLCETETDELLGSDSGTEFTTSANAVGSFTSVKKGATGGGPGGATALDPVTDYDESDMDEYAAPGKVTLIVALTTGESLWATYDHWYLDKEISWVVEQLLLLAGFVDYVVDPTIFTTDIENTWPQTTQAHFEAGVLTHIDTKRTPDSFRIGDYIIDDFLDGNFSADPQWLVKYTQSASYSIVDQALRCYAYCAMPNIGISGFETPRTDAVGTWMLKVDATMATPAQANGGDGIRFMFMQVQSYGVSGYVQGYSLQFTANHASGTRSAVLLQRHDGLIFAQASVTLLDCGTIPSGEHIWKITRDANGVFKVYMDGGFLGQVTDATYSTSAYIGFHGLITASTSWMVLSVDDIMFFAATPTGNLVSQVLDATVGLTAWGLLTYNVAFNGGTILVETLSSETIDFSSGNDPAGWVPLSDSGQIQSIAGACHYLKARLALTAYTGGSVVGTPVVSDFTVKYYTSSTLLPLVNMTGMSCYDGILECAKFAAYEVGFKADDTFFYRQRITAAASVITLSAFTNVIHETAYNSGRDRIYNRIDANFGTYRATVDCITEEETEPHSIQRDGLKSYSISSSLLPKEGANIAAAAAQTIYTYTSAPRRRASVDIKYLIHLELGDAVLYERDHKFGRWLWGDSKHAYGEESDNFIYYSDADLVLWNMPARIEGIEFDTDPKKKRMRLDLVENI